MKKGSLVYNEYGKAKVIGITKQGVKVIWMTGKLKGKEANIDKKYCRSVV